MEKLARQFARADHFQKRALGIGVREHHSAAKFGSILELAALPRAWAGVDLRAGRRGPISSAELGCPPSDCLRDRAHPSHDVAVEPLDLICTAAQKMKKQSDRGSRLIGSAVLAIEV